jgi:hypothetical protein
MPRDRYLLLLRLQHFSDKNNQPEGDWFYKTKPIIGHLNKQFNEVFTPFENLCIDERAGFHFFSTSLLKDTDLG